MMQDLIDCLYFYSEDHCVLQRLETPEYRRAVCGLERDWQGFRALLPEDQRRQLDSLLSRQFTVKHLESQAVFRSGLSIGLELARL